MIYRAICQDPRHYNIVELLCDYAHLLAVLAKREWNYLICACTSGMTFYRPYSTKVHQNFSLTYDDRALQFFSYFCPCKPNNPTYFEIPAEDSRLFIADGSDKELDSCALSPTINDHFAFHPYCRSLYRGGIIAFLKPLCKMKIAHQP